MESKASILIIEDDPEIQELLSIAMAGEGWKLVQARTGEEGLEYIRRNQALAGRAVHCILLDIMLPGADGFRILKKIRGIDACLGVPVIMTTARGEESDIVTGLELGADDYVVKP